MVRIFLYVAAVIGLYLVVLPPVPVVADVPPFPSQVEMVAKPGVSKFELQIARRAVSFTARFMDERCQLALNHPVKVVLTADQASYFAVLRDEEQLDGDIIRSQLARSTGTTVNDHVIINAGAVEYYRDMVFITAHEMVHQYQPADAAQAGLCWLTEGTADVVAANVVAADSGKTAVVDEYRRNWLKVVKSDGHRPGLEMLDAKADWLAAVRRDAPVAYRTAALAVLYLTDRNGYGALAAYWQLRAGGKPPEPAFQQAFGLSSAQFAAQFAAWLAQQDSKR
ncbi:hypothetical protein [Sporolituus thermophilus]|uniref:hypothetical protein n=1 Tax=Sporolituus thermophilus TaxID=608505 RepID=UPI000B83A794|nr:hypothetical protein [Sporolituus thermophilus]